MEPKSITLSAASKIYGATKNALYKLVFAGELHSKKSGKHIFLSVAELEQRYMP